MGSPNSPGTRKFGEKHMFLAVHMYRKLWIFIFLLLLSLKVCQVNGEPENSADKGEVKNENNQETVLQSRTGRSVRNFQEILMNFEKDSYRLPLGNGRDNYRIPDIVPPTAQPDDDDDNDRKDRFSFMPGAPGSEYMLPYPRPGRSNTLSTSDNENKLDNTEFGQSSSSKSRPGRSLPNQEVTHNGNPISTSSQEVESSEFITPYPRIGKKSTESLIPYLRFGRQNDQTLLPYLRFGRKDDVANYYESITPYPRMGKRSDDILRPYFRFGRSNIAGEMHETSFDCTPVQTPLKKLHETIEPYIRFKRSSGNTEEGNHHLLAPYPRMGRSSGESLVPHLRFGREEEDQQDTEGIYITPYPRIGKKSNDVLLPHIRFGRQEEFITPYPRLGRQSKGSVLPVMRFGRQSEYLTPYPRIGKKSSEYLTPYPRLGKKSKESLVPVMRFGRSNENTKDNDFDKSNQRNKRDENTLLPYLRFDREENSDSSNDFLTPYPRLGKKSESSSSILPHLRFGRNSNEYLMPYPRFGKREEETLIPHLRFGRSGSYGFGNGIEYQNDLSNGNSLTNQIPDEGTQVHGSDSSIPLRLARSDYVDDVETSDDIANTTESEEQETLIPYPRFGRSSEDHPQQDGSQNSKSILSKRSQPNGPNLSKMIQKQIGNDIYSDDSSDDFSYILPYPRPGRTVFLNAQKPAGQLHNYNQLKPAKAHMNIDEDNLMTNNYMLPYLRPGRSTNVL